ncbi:RING U-box superfamily isoform 1 [Olea europaea subsp. europaea]|uniref:RING U-box superfamily isoform 1 n=1 Tax=Olea europaea subsp. europaea TaxID=158383 RepID=A0A8S0SB77_OLEEU|nr:RING U-box superfamily isoform 1 [Olea europaea subsp. europaea]
MSAAVEMIGHQLINDVRNLSIQNELTSLGLGVSDLGSLDPVESEVKGNCTAAPEEIHQAGCETNNMNDTNHHGVCAICLDKIALQETALVKGCEHAYCITCILQWASYKEEPLCPQCRNPFEFLNIHRSLDGSVHHYMFEESVFLLLGATRFKPLIVVDQEEVDVVVEDYYYYEDDEEEDLDDVYFGSSSNLRIGNRRWGDNGYVRGGRQEARPIHRPNTQDLGAGPSHRPKRKEPAREMVGRRAKRALKREAADKAAAAKHERHLMRLGHKSG